MRALLLLLCLSVVHAEDVDVSYHDFASPEVHRFQSPENGPLFLLTLVPSDDHQRIARVDVSRADRPPLQSLPVSSTDRPLSDQKYFKILEIEPVSYYGFRILASERVVSRTALYGRGIATFWYFWKYDPITQRFEADPAMSAIPDPRFRPDGTFESWLTKDLAGWERATYQYQNGQPEKIVELEGVLEDGGYRCYETRFIATGPVRKKVKCPTREALRRPAE